DERWITVADFRSPISYIAPLHGEAPIQQSELIPTTEGAHYWSPDGAMVYGPSSRDGFLCIWAQRLDPVKKTSIGAAFPIYHSHSARRALIAGSGFVARNQYIL